MKRLTPDALVYETVSAAEPQLSPDGAQLVYGRGKADRELDRGTSQIAYVVAFDPENPNEEPPKANRARSARVSRCSWL